MNDPNGLVYLDGEYHLFYQYNPHGDTWGHMSWGHAVSRDLVHWQHLPLALAEEPGLMIFSGSAVVDGRNTSGLGGAGAPPLCALFTGHHTERPLQNQHLAYSTDRGRTWRRYARNPVLDIGDPEFRDPKVFWHEPTARWIMVVSRAVRRQLSLHASPDLKSWTHLSDFGPAGSVEGIWECPDLFPLAVDGDPARERWVLLLNVNPGAPAGGSGCQYFVGDFDGRVFRADPVPEGGLWADYGADFYAAVTWSDLPAEDGRRIAIGWMNNWWYGNQLPTAPWRGAMTVPRELTLRDTPDGPRLCQQPVRELDRLRHGAARAFHGGFADAAAWIARQTNLPELLDIEITLSGLTPSSRIALHLCTASSEETVVAWEGGSGRVSLDRSRSGLVGFHPAFAATHAAPLRVGSGILQARILVDTSSIEVFAQGGESVLTDLVFPASGPRSLRLAGDAAAPSTVRIAVHELRAAPPVA